MKELTLHETQQIAAIWVEGLDKVLPQTDELRAAKLQEETYEVIAEYENGRQHLASELGDLFFVGISIAHSCGYDLNQIIWQTLEKNYGRINTAIIGEMMADGELDGETIYKQAKQRHEEALKPSLPLGRW